MSTGRRDWCVILARGDSVRMGRPKGLCRLAGDGMPFLVRICRLYARAGIPVAVVTRPDLAAIYGAEAPGAEVAAWVTHERGGGTAASCLAAAAALSEQASHLWFHPVDLPLVTAETLDSLAAASVESPDRILVPYCDGQRGHPVITPLDPWRDLSPDDHPGSMKDLIQGRDVPVRRILLADPGIRQDFDSPADFESPEGFSRPPQDRN